MRSAVAATPFDAEVANQHNGSGSLASNNTLVRRLLTLVALKTSARCFRSEPSCIRISRNTVVKTGPYVHLMEAQSMQFVADNTSLPVPKVWCSFVHNERAYIVMERIRGQEIPRAWKTLSQQSRAEILRQLKAMLQELRSLQPPSMGVASCMGGSLRDSRIPMSRPRFGPFESIQQFHRWLREDFELPEEQTTESAQDWQDIDDMITKQNGPWPPPVFTHGDLNPFNILVHDDKIVGIIDWEFSGWYPHYWEYSSAWHGNQLATEWQGLLHTFIEPHPEELKMDSTRKKWWGDF